MATTPESNTATSATKSSRGQDQLNWSSDRWARADAAVADEMTSTRVAGKFLKAVFVPKNAKIVPADLVVTPTPPQGTGAAFDPALNVTETVTRMIQEPRVEFYLTGAQNEDEASEDTAIKEGASTFSSLSIKAANILAQVEDLVVHNGQNAFYHSLLAPPYPLVNFLDNAVGTDLDLGLAFIQPTTPMGPGGTPPPAGPNKIMLPQSQVVLVPPSPSTPPGSSPWYLDQSVDAFVEAVSILNSNGYHGNYFASVHHYIKADLSRTLPTTFMTALEPLERVFTAGIHAGILPPYSLPPVAGQSGLPLVWSDGTTLINGTVLYIGVVGSLGGNSMDLVRGALDVDANGNPLDAAVAFLAKDGTGKIRFIASQRFALRVKDPNALVLCCFMDFVATQLVFTAPPTSTLSGKPINPVTVQVQDGSGHLVTRSTASVKIAIGTNPGTGTGTGTLNGTQTVSAAAGIATFSNLSITGANTGYTLVATSQGLSSATSVSFNIN